MSYSFHRVTTQDVTGFTLPTEVFDIDKGGVLCEYPGAYREQVLNDGRILCSTQIQAKPSGGGTVAADIGIRQLKADIDKYFQEVREFSGNLDLIFRVWETDALGLGAKWSQIYDGNLIEIPHEIVKRDGSAVIALFELSWVRSDWQESGAVFNGEHLKQDAPYGEVNIPAQYTGRIERVRFRKFGGEGITKLWMGIQRRNPITGAPPLYIDMDWADIKPASGIEARSGPSDTEWDVGTQYSGGTNFSILNPSGVNTLVMHFGRVSKFAKRFAIPLDSWNSVLYSTSTDVRRYMVGEYTLLMRYALTTNPVDAAYEIQAFTCYGDVRTAPTTPGPVVWITKDMYPVDEEGASRNLMQTISLGDITIGNGLSHREIGRTNLENFQIGLSAGAYNKPTSGFPGLVVDRFFLIPKTNNVSLSMPELPHKYQLVISTDPDMTVTAIARSFRGSEALGYSVQELITETEANNWYMPEADTYPRLVWVVDSPDELLSSRDIAVRYEIAQRARRHLS